MQIMVLWLINNTKKNLEKNNTKNLHFRWNQYHFILYLSFRLFAILIYGTSSHIYVWVMIFEQLFGDNFCDNLPFLSSYWSKIIERKRKRENKNIMWVWKRRLYKSYHKMDVQISFLYMYKLLVSSQRKSIDYL